MRRARARVLVLAEKPKDGRDGRERARRDRVLLVSRRAAGESRRPSRRGRRGGGGSLVAKVLAGREARDPGGRAMRQPIPRDRLAGRASPRISERATAL